MIYTGDCIEIMASLDAESIDSIVTDPPYGLSFMGKGWDHGVPGVQFWAEALRVAKPGAHLLAFGGTRTYHRLTCAIEDAGWEIRDCVMWVYGSGFPKSLDVSKAIDKAAGAEREVVGHGTNSMGRMNQNNAKAGYRPNPYSDGIDGVPITAPATDAARQWSGWGTALKPAWEPIIVARKPLCGTVAENVLTHGTGGINVDGCRIGTEPAYTDRPRGPHSPLISQLNGHGTVSSGGNGRWPSNLIHDGSDEVVGLFPENVKGQVGMSKTQGGHRFIVGDTETVQKFDYGTTDTGSAARFFYCAKSSRTDRNEGLDSTCTVKYNVHIGGALCNDVAMVLVELLRRATCELTLKWHIGESGESITGLCPSDSLFTTVTAISRITESKILSLLTHSLISDCIAGVRSATANGGNRAENADNSSGLQVATTPEKLEELARGVRLAVSPMLSRISSVESWIPQSNFHATVKPTTLMRYLCRLVTPPGGTVLDPFCGSGSTGKAATLEGFEFIGIEREAEYVAIAERRIEHARGLMPLLTGMS